MTQIILYVDECPEYPEGIKILPSKWVICPECLGEGKSSAHLGSFTMDEFEERFETLEEQDDYFDGKYDRLCPSCSGTGKVKVLDESRCTQEDLEEYQFQMEQRIRDALEAAAERRLGA